MNVAMPVGSVSLRINPVLLPGLLILLEYFGKFYFYVEENTNVK